MKSILLVSFTIIISLIIGILIVLLSNLDGGIILLITFLIFSFSGLTIWLRYRNHGANDPLLLFTTVFLLYNGVLSLQVAWEFANGREPLLLYPVTFSYNTFLEASITSCLASAGLLVGTVLIMLFSSKKSLASRTYITEISSSFFKIGLFAFLFGLLLFFLDFQRIGGFVYALSLARGVRGMLLSSLRGNLPYAPFVFVGLAMVWADYSYRRIGKFWPYLLLGIWILLMLLQGDRRFLTYGILISFFTYTAIRYPKLQIKGKYIILLAVLLLTFFFFAQIRWMFPLILAGKMSLGETFKWIQNNFSLDWFIPGKNEFAGPYFTLLYSLQYSWPKEAPLLGTTYLQAIPNLLPRSLYPGEKPLGISQIFAIFIHQEYMPTRESIIGWGYSPVAEAYNNFGFLGPFIVFFIFTICWELISRLRFKDKKGLIIYSLLIPQVLNLNRIDFMWVFQEGMYFVVVGLLLLVLRSIMSSIRLSTKYFGYKSHNNIIKQSKVFRYAKN
ncbi:oligosaccharide repeat unit polymerase [Thermoanaerobacter sp. RKWS2]|uniref:oligosaccharide repeat unit polymerase n=1 Tax=Thermoanaerobacter sp. RKWS2 TaxID=2983842 RepID=UPI001A0FB14A|nr:O-antigen polysaccharide polymerase Wzy [Thermoanaerobacter sp. RKWS2]MBE3591909.1 O-antigen polysaccharide polymerase Wzy [Thermoanaerobacter sp.]UZQ83662.1 O-antigen polysaccharide polymerase Wzy family protein [Thermoanaerobacter sp. RKWS2]